MSFKTSLLWACLFFIFNLSCKFPNTESNGDLDKTSAKQEVKNDNEIVDSWAMCSTSSKELVTQMNTCATVTFIGNGMGFVMINAAIKEQFNWTIKNESVKIVYEDSAVSHTFPDTFYHASFSKEKDLINLTLSHDQDKYYLSRFINDRH